ncbi:MAG: ATPase, T2SS/T4P/T4SS family [Planctomycetia bacterium]
MASRGRTCCVRLAAGLFACAPWAVASAADAWPTTIPDSGAWLARDSGGGLTNLTLALWWAGVAGWTATSSWLAGDAVRFKVRPDFWKPIVIFPFVAFALMAWWIPWSAVGQILMALAWIVPLVLYARERNPKAPASESILTQSHLGRAWRALLRKLGVKVADDLPISDGLPWVKLSAIPGATPEETAKAQRDLETMEGLPAATKLLQEAVAARSGIIVIESTADGLRVGHDVDGIPGAARDVRTPAKGRGKSRQPDIWGDAPPLQPAVGAAALAVFRTLAGVDPAQAGSEKDAAFTIEVDTKKKACRLTSRATKTAKQVTVTIDMPPFVPKKLEELGMEAELATRVRSLIALEKGLFVVSSPAANGCTTTFDTVLTSADRLLRDFVSIEDATKPPREIQNVKPVRYSVVDDEKPTDALKKAMLEYPRAIVTRDMVDKELAAELLNLADDQQFVLVSLRAADSIDAVSKLLDLGIDRAQLARCLLGSLSQRLVRKLCASCGESVPTPPKLLPQFKKTAEELPEIKRASQYGGCGLCRGRQFMGRTAIFELAAGPLVRQAIAEGRDAKTIRQAAVKDGMRSLTEAGMAMVAAGASSLEEMQRVFAPKKEAGPAGVKK